MNSNEAKHAIRTLSPAEYPEALIHAEDVPKALYLRGEFPSEDHVFLTVVGSRGCTEYGALACKKLIAGLRGYPVVIVSGLAYGIDALAHEAALENGIKTIAIPGSGIADDMIYPTVHVELARRILDAGGCVLSPFPETVMGNKWTFPFRNRIMAALSKATLVIEADLKSGTLITSKWAGELNRDVLAVPGSIFSPKSAGPHQLIQSGATPITCPEDLLEALGLEARDKKSAADYSRLSADERRVMELLAEPMTRQKLIELLNMETAHVNMLISMLELKDLIEETLGELRRTDLS